MIRETMIHAERDYVDERLCGVNDMTFEEWEQYQDQMLRYYNVYQYDNGPYEEDENESLDEDDEWDKNRRSCHCNDDLCLSRVTSPGSHLGQDEDDESDEDNDGRVCLCDPTDIGAGTCCCNHLGLRCNGKCRPDGYDSWLDARRATL